VALPAGGVFRRSLADLGHRGTDVDCKAAGRTDVGHTLAARRIGCRPSAAAERPIAATT
jgi:hypothetical protein